MLHGLKIVFVGRKPTSELTLKHNGTTVVVVVRILKVVNIWRSVLQKNVFQKGETLNPNHLLLEEKYVTITIVE